MLIGKDSLMLNYKHWE